MIDVSIKIGSAATAVSMKDTYSLIYLSSSNIISPSVREFETTSYPEDSGDHVLAKSTYEPFDYTITFLVNTSNANSTINTFNQAIAPNPISGAVRTFNTVEVFNTYKKVSIKGIPSLLSEPTVFWRDPNGVLPDVVQVDLKIHVYDPTLCSFNYSA